MDASYEEWIKNGEDPSIKNTWFSGSGWGNSGRYLGDPLEGDFIQEDEYALEYGEATTQNMVRELEESFKFLWDGSISFFKDAVLASQTNKHLVQSLLDFRTRT